MFAKALGAFEKESVALAFYCLVGHGKSRRIYCDYERSVKGVNREPSKAGAHRRNMVGIFGNCMEYRRPGDKAIVSVVLGQFSEDQESEKPSQFVRSLPVDPRKPLTKRFARLFFPWTLATEQIRRYRGAVSCLKRFCAAGTATAPVPATPAAVPGERIFSSAVADKLLAPVLLTIARNYDVECVTEAKVSEDTAFMCDFSESMWGRTKKE